MTNFTACEVIQHSWWDAGKSHWKEGRSIGVILYIMKEVQYQESGGRTWIEIMEECCLVFPHGLLGLLSFTPQDHLLRGSITHNVLYPSTSISSQENAPQRLAYRPLWWGCFSVEVPSSQMTLSWTDKNNNQNLTNLDPVAQCGCSQEQGIWTKHL